MILLCHPLRAQKTPPGEGGCDYLNPDLSFVHHFAYFLHNNIRNMRGEKKKS
jgi:hypothetical protein